MKELGFQNEQALQQIAADDRDSARKMHMAVRDYSTPILSFMVVLAFFGSIYLLLTQVVSIEDGMRDVVMMLLGTLAASFTQVMNFRFGTSAGSRDKTEMLRTMIK